MPLIASSSSSSLSWSICVWKCRRRREEAPFSLPTRVHPKAEKREERESLFLSLYFHPASLSSLAWEVFQSGTNCRKCHTLTQKSVFISKLPFQRLSKKKMECNAYSSFQIWVSSDKCCFVFSCCGRKSNKLLRLLYRIVKAFLPFPFSHLLKWLHPSLSPLFFSLLLFRPYFQRMVLRA